MQEATRADERQSVRFEVLEPSSRPAPHRKLAFSQGKTSVAKLMPDDNLSNLGNAVKVPDLKAGVLLQISWLSLVRCQL